jgi:GldM C-terminal domain/Gram-negative bacterial TonB protein C-terminal
MPSPKIILLLTLSVLTISVHSQNTAPPPPPPDSVQMKDGIFERVEIEAAFPGGDAGWRKFLEKNLNPNVPVDNGAPVGMYNVFVEFIVDRDGSISEIKPITKIGYGTEQEVIRIVKGSGKWSPAVQNGKAVRAWRKQPVTFMVTAEDYNISSKVPYVLFTGMDNEITVEVSRVKTSDIRVTIEAGTITSLGDGKFNVRVNKPGRMIIEMYNTKKKKTIGSVSFEVREGKNK